MKILVLIFLIIYSIPTLAEMPYILGSTQYWSDYDKTIKDIKVSNLRIKQVRLKDANCSDGYKDVLELDGEFNEDTVFAIEKLLETMKNCDDSPPIVTLNSGGGYIVSGIEVGRIFRKFGVMTWLVEGQKCQSSCSTAFFGGKVRRMSSDTELLMHSPYLVTSPFSISCMSKIEAQRLKDYYVEMLKEKDGELLFERTMKYCSTTDGWRLNKDGAELFGLLIEEENFTETYYDFPETFTTNLKGSRKMLQVGIGVSTQYDDVVLEGIANHELKLRSVILAVMSKFSEEDIRGETGRDNLAKAITKELNKKLEQLEGFGGVENAYFTSFILQ